DYDDLDSNGGRSDFRPRFRNEWNAGRHGNRRHHQGITNPEVVRRVMVGDNTGGGTGVGPMSGTNCGLAPGETWMRVNVVHGASIPLDFLRENLGAALGTPIRIYNANLKGENRVFFFKMRAKKLGTHRKAVNGIVNPNTGAPLVCDINPCREPEVPLNVSDASAGSAPALLPSSWMDALRECFRERFQATTRVLDLSSLHTDLTLLSKGFYIPLDKTPVFSSFVAILQENNAQLAILNLSNNRLRHVQPFEDMAKSMGPPTYSIERIDLSANALTQVRNLEALKHVPGVCHLDVTETPLSGRLSNPNHAKFMEAQIVRILPALKTLNGNPIKVTVEFAIEHASNASTVTRGPRFPLPKTIQGYFPNEEIRIPLLTFLKEYFSRYDSSPRGENIYSYYTSASTLTMCLNPASQFSGKSVSETIEANDGSSQKTVLLTNNLDDAYFKQNRNLLRCKDEHKRHELICQGSLDIASALGKLPATEHVLESFCIDVIFHSESQILFNVSGVFYEIKRGAGSNAPLQKVLRCFARSMILVAPGSQILQDDIIFSNPSESLIQRYIRDVKKRASTSGVSRSSAPMIPPSVPAGANEREVMLSEFRRQTGMNMAFCRQCLEEFGWQFDTALSSFQSMHAAGTIPQAAFAPD
ncbi:unnamed protein product, partial [Mesocestoides corti]